MSPDLNHPVSSAETIRASSVPAWRVAIDFGTTHTSIAVVAGSADSEASDNLESIGGFPGDRALDRIDMQVPTEIAYLSKENDNAVSAHRVVRRVGGEVIV